VALWHQQLPPGFHLCQSSLQYIVVSIDNHLKKPLHSSQTTGTWNSRTTETIFANTTTLDVDVLVYALPAQCER
jgi:hypothetical protein